jgi:NAD(P)-dependent dehydrogenase (short-subunit alcohol dehydrogenase family)
MLQFQQLMSRFLETQKQVMTAYLNEAPGAAAQVDERLTEWEAPAPSPASSQTPLGPELEERADRPAQASTPEVPRASEPAPADLHEAEVSPVERSVGAAEPGLGREQLAQRLLQIVSERTGYPTEMLDLGVDIEADLGIDSIKRVEILGAFQRAHIPADRRVGEEAMDQLTGIKTLRGIVDWIDRALSAGAEEATDEEEIRRPEAAVAEEGSDEAYSQVSRHTWAAVDAPLVDDRAIGLASDRVFLITDDGRGVSGAVADGICDLGGRAVVVQSGEGAGAVERARYQADLTDPAAVGELVATVHQQEGPIGGIVHLLPLQEEAEFAAESLASWRDRLRREVKSLFFLAKAAAEDLKDAGESGGAWLVAATGMGGSNGVGAAEEQALFPGQAGIAGLVRTVALEWPTVRCEVVDFASLDDGSLLAERLLHEIASDDGEVAVGYQGTQRRALRLRPSPLDGRSVHLAIDSDWVILVTGGARGITAEAACELAEQYQPTLLLAGRSPLPEPQESPQTAGLTSPHELKSALMDGMRQAGEKVELSQINSAQKPHMNEPAMRPKNTRKPETGSTLRNIPQ